MSETQNEVYRQFRTAQDKYAYFLMAAAGAGIGLAVNQTQTATINRSKIPLAGAIICWALSFVFGCRYIGTLTSSLYSNMELLKVQAGEHPKVGRHPQVIAAASEGIRNALEKHGNRATRFGRNQFVFLVAGAVLYVVWHVWEMWLRTPHSFSS